MHLSHGYSIPSAQTLFTFSSYIYISSTKLIAIRSFCRLTTPSPFTFTLSRPQLHPSPKAHAQLSTHYPLTTFSFTCPNFYLLHIATLFHSQQLTQHWTQNLSPFLPFLPFFPKPHLHLHTTSTPPPPPSPPPLPPPSSPPGPLTPSSLKNLHSLGLFFHAALSSKYSVLRGRLLSVILSRGEEAALPLDGSLCACARDPHSHKYADCVL